MLCNIFSGFCPLRPGNDSERDLKTWLFPGMLPYYRKRGGVGSEYGIKALVLLCRVAGVFISGLPAAVGGIGNAAPTPEIDSGHFSSPFPTISMT